MRPTLIAGFMATALVGVGFGYFAGHNAGVSSAQGELNAGAIAAISSLGREMDRTFDEVASDIADDPQRGTVSVKPASPPPPFGVKLKSKAAGDPAYERGINVAVTLENRTGRAVRAFDGVMAVTDLLDNELISAKLVIDDRVGPGGSAEWSGVLDYNRFLANHERFSSTPIEDLKIRFKPRRILYADGTTQDFH